MVDTSKIQNPNVTPTTWEERREAADKKVAEKKESYVKIIWTGMVLAALSLVFFFCAIWTTGDIVHRFGVTGAVLAITGFLISFFAAMARDLIHYRDYM